MPGTAKKGKYKGVLAQPITMKPTSNGLLNPYGGEERWRKELTEKRVGKLTALFAHYGIDPKDPGATAKLAMSLAVAHVTGFQTAKKRGPMPKGFDFDLWARVRLKQLENKGHLSVANACTILAKKDGQSANTMRRRYTEANKCYGRLAADLPADEFRAMLDRATKAPANPG